MAKICELLPLFLVVSKKSSPLLTEIGTSFGDKTEHLTQKNRFGYYAIRHLIREILLISLFIFCDEFKKNKAT